MCKQKNRAVYTLYTLVKSSSNRASTYVGITAAADNLAGRTVCWVDGWTTTMLLLNKIEQTKNIKNES